MNERVTLNNALDKLVYNTGIAAQSIKYKPAHATYDAQLKVENCEYVVEIKRLITKNNVGGVIHQIQFAAKERAPMIVADYINPNIADILQNEGINYLDTVGNAHIKNNGLFILIKGNKPPAKVVVKVGRAFTATGLKVIYALLVEPKLLNAPYRDIAEAANVALGTVGWVLRDLREQDFVVEGLKNKLRKWNQKTKNQLIDKWVEHYPALKAKHTLGHYTTTKANWWKEANLDKYRGLFAGEIAAHKLTRYLKPHDHLVYLQGNKLNEFLNDFRLAATKGNTEQLTKIEVVDIFWGETLIEKETTTHPLLTYADLISTADARNRETAMIIKEQYFDW